MFKLHLKSVVPVCQFTVFNWDDLRKERELMKKEPKPSLYDAYKAIKGDLRHKSKPKEEKVDNMKSIKFWVEKDVYQFVKMAALLQKRSMSDLFREYARTVAQNAQEELKNRVGKMGYLKKVEEPEVAPSGVPEEEPF